MEEQSCSGAFEDLNRGKASLVLDLTTCGGHDAMLRLVRASDAVVENFSPRVMPNLGLNYSTLAAERPELVMLSMPAFGADGPWSNYVAFGSGIELATGLARRAADGRPCPAPLAFTDYLAGVYGALGVIAVLVGRDETSRGAYIELAQRELACHILAQTPASQESQRFVDPWKLSADPHLLSRGLLGRRPRTTTGCQHYARPPWRFYGVANRRLERERAAPLFGSDSRTILRRVAGLDHATIDELVETGVVCAA
jgi:crotonobetainyl-CoA:carnitine CoA-transferase CaiB-like acyl-CoA transferase